MSNWDYIVGETGFDQPFALFDKGTNQAVIDPGFSSASITIVKTDLTPSDPVISDVALALVSTDPLKVKYALTVANMPQTKGSYLGIITVISGGQTKKTFEVDLQVYRG